MHFSTFFTLLTFSVMGVQPGASHSELYISRNRKGSPTKTTFPGVITGSINAVDTVDTDDCYMPCDEQGVWIGPRSDASGSVEDTAVALKRFEDELAEFQRLGEERLAAGDNEALVKVRLPDDHDIE